MGGWVQLLPARLAHGGGDGARTPPTPMQMGSRPRAQTLKYRNGYPIVEDMVGVGVQRAAGRAEGLAQAAAVAGCGCG